MSLFPNSIKLTKQVRVTAFDEGHDLWIIDPCQEIDRFVTLQRSGKFLGVALFLAWCLLCSRFFAFLLYVFKENRRLTFKRGHFRL